MKKSKFSVGTERKTEQNALLEAKWNEIRHRGTERKKSFRVRRNVPFGEIPFLNFFLSH